MVVLWEIPRFSAVHFVTVALDSLPLVVALALLSIIEFDLDTTGGFSDFLVCKMVSVSENILKFYFNTAFLLVENCKIEFSNNDF